MNLATQNEQINELHNLPAKNEFSQKSELLEHSDMTQDAQNRNPVSVFNTPVAHTETSTAVVKHEQQEEGGLLTINGTLVVIAVSFILFVFVMQKIFYGPIAEIKRRRSDYIKTVLEEANTAFQVAENLNKDYQEGLRDARKRVAENTANQLNEANEEKNKMLEGKKQEISAFLNEQKQIIQNEKSQAIESLKDQVMDYAYNISKKILGEEVSMESLSTEIVDKALGR